MSLQSSLEVGDFVAGISVALVLIPQAIAYATLAGLPPIHGIYAAIFAPIIAAFFVSSPYLQTGPVAMTSLLALGVLSTLSVPMSPEYIGLAALLALLVGFMRILVGIFHSGYIAYLMSQPVLAGFTAAVALLIISTQISTLLGVSVQTDGVIFSSFWSIIHPADWSPPAMVLGLVTMLIILIGKRLHPSFPGVLIAVVLGIGYSHLINYTGPVIGNLPSSLPVFSLDLPWHDIPKLIIPAAVISLVGFAEPAAIARTMAAKNRQLWSVDREFISQGIANIAVGISGGFPVGGSFSRTMVNVAAGGKTRWSGAIAGLTVLAFLPIISILAPLPKSILAAIVISSVLNLVDVRSLYKMLKVSRTQGILAWVTFALTLALAPRVDLAVLIGVALSVAIHLWRERQIGVRRYYGDHSLRLEPVGVLYFGSAYSLNEKLVTALAEHPGINQLTLDLRKVGRIDYTGALILQQVAIQAESAGLEVRIICGQPPQGRRLLQRVFGVDSPWLINKD